MKATKKEVFRSILEVARMLAFAVAFAAAAAVVIYFGGSHGPRKWLAVLAAGVLACAALATAWGTFGVMWDSVREWWCRTRPPK